jgi:hypothetical protein
MHFVNVSDVKTPGTFWSGTDESTDSTEHTPPLMYHEEIKVITVCHRFSGLGFLLNKVQPARASQHHITT